MLVYDLQCDQGHGFEGWFEGVEDLESQLARGLVACPVCGGDQVRRVPSGFAIAKRGGEANQEVSARLLGMALKRYLRENFEDVGSGFATEALKIHYGASAPRNIRGVSTAQEEEVLKNEGVSFFKVGETAEAPEPEGSDED